VTHAHGKERAEHTAAVHGEGGDKIEDDEEDIGDGKLVHHRYRRVLDAREILHVELRAEGKHENGGDHDIDGRSGDGNDELFAGLVGHALQARNASEGPQGHVSRVYAIMLGREDMAELVEHHAKKQERNEGYALPRRFRAALLVKGEPDPGQEKQEGHVNTYRRSGNPSDGNGPRHEWLQRREAPRTLAKHDWAKMPEWPNCIRSFPRNRESSAGSPLSRGRTDDVSASVCAPAWPRYAGAGH
jgi:hypothetical protein